MKVKKYEELDIWRMSTNVALEVYKITRNNDFKKDFGLSDQIRRAVVSISSNIVEGFERNNNNEFIQYLRIAKGSTGEVRNQLFISYKLGYLSTEEYTNISAELDLLSNKIGRFIVYLSSKRKNNEFRTR